MNFQMVLAPDGTRGQQLADVYMPTFIFSKSKNGASQIDLHRF